MFERIFVNDTGIRSMVRGMILNDGGLESLGSQTRTLTVIKREKVGVCVCIDMGLCYIVSIYTYVNYQLCDLSINKEI